MNAQNLHHLVISYFTATSKMWHWTTQAVTFGYLISYISVSQTILYMESADDSITSLKELKCSGIFIFIYHKLQVLWNLVFSVLRFPQFPSIYCHYHDLSPWNTFPCFFFYVIIQRFLRSIFFQVLWFRSLP